jgi:hypothetical protein
VNFGTAGASGEPYLIATAWILNNISADANPFEAAVQTASGSGSSITIPSHTVSGAYGLLIAITSLFNTDFSYVRTKNPSGSTPSLTGSFTAGGIGGSPSIAWSSGVPLGSGASGVRSADVVDGSVAPDSADSAHVVVVALKPA